MKLSEHFTLAELTASQTAARRGIDNTPGPVALANLSRLAATLEQVRALAGPITVSSGYRSPALNKVVRGSKTSAHVLGLAADITARGMTPKQLATLIRDAGIEFDQCILEFDRWVHIGLSAGKARGKVLTARLVGGSTSYVDGIV